MFLENGSSLCTSFQCSYGRGHSEFRRNRFIAFLKCHCKAMLFRYCFSVAFNSFHLLRKYLKVDLPIECYLNTVGKEHSEFRRNKFLAFLNIHYRAMPFRDYFSVISVLFTSFDNI